MSTFKPAGNIVFICPDNGRIDVALESDGKSVRINTEISLTKNATLPDAEGNMQMYATPVFQMFTTLMEAQRTKGADNAKG